MRYLVQSERISCLRLRLFQHVGVLYRKRRTVSSSPGMHRLMTPNDFILLLLHSLSLFSHRRQSGLPIRARDISGQIQLFPFLGMSGCRLQHEMALQLQSSRHRLWPKEGPLRPPCQRRLHWRHFARVAYDEAKGMRRPVPCGQEWRHCPWRGHGWLIVRRPHWRDSLLLIQIKCWRWLICCWLSHQPLTEGSSVTCRWFRVINYQHLTEGSSVTYRWLRGHQSPATDSGAISHWLRGHRPPATDSGVISHWLGGQQSPISDLRFISQPVNHPTNHWWNTKPVGWLFFKTHEWLEP